MITLQAINEYYDRLNRRLIEFGKTQKVIEHQRQGAFLDNAQKAYEIQKDQDALFEGELEQAKVEGEEIKYEE